MSKYPMFKNINIDSRDYATSSQVRKTSPPDQNVVSINQDSDETRPLILCKEHDYALCSFQSIQHQFRNLFGRRQFDRPNFSEANISLNMRFITNTGRRNTITKNAPRSLKRYSKTVFQTLVNLRWPYQFLFVSVAFITTWLFFGLLWWGLEQLMIYMFDDDCIAGVDGLYSAFLFSIETQTTIGYGSHYVKNTCRIGIGILLLQIVSGVLIQSLIVAIVISKFTHPKWRKRNVMFSDNLCVFEERGSKIVAFRIADMTNGELSLPEAHVRVYLIHSMQSTPGGNTPRREGCLAMEELDIGYNKGHDRILLLVPWVVEHVVTPRSPLFNKSKQEIEEGVFEIVVILEGSVEESGSVTQCIKSYTGQDILWGYNFNTMISKRGGKFQIDFHKLNSCFTTPNVSNDAFFQSSTEQLNQQNSFTETDDIDKEASLSSVPPPRKRSFVTASFQN